MIDETHAPTARSWVESAEGHQEFPIQNLPFGVFRRAGELEHGHIGVRIGDAVLDLNACRRAGLLAVADGAVADACGEPVLNRLMALGRDASRSLRRTVFDILKSGSEHETTARASLVPMAEVEMLLPASIGDYTDFYASIHHATNVGSMFRPDNPLLPNYKWVPIGYHGRASSIVVSGASVRRPSGQTKEEKEAAPVFGPSKRLDFELEVGMFIGRENSLGTSIPLAEAEEHAFGLCLVNDWSARDVQTWEYQPLGPFLAKSFATTISPWAVTLEALEPFRLPRAARPNGDPQPLPYLENDRDRDHGGFDLQLEIWISTTKMKADSIAPVRVSRGSFREMYWTLGQMLTHHASNGCNLRPGDLIASGTVSGREKDERGSMLELSWRGTEPLDLPTGEQRKFLEDGDTVTLRAFCEKEGSARIGFGECAGTVVSG